MSNLHSSFELFRKVCLLAVLGFAALVLIGPVIAVLSVALSLVLVIFPFAFIGFLVWTLVQVAVGGKRLAWHNVREVGHVFQETLGHFGRLFAQTVQAPLRIGKAIGVHATHLAGGLWQAAKFGARVVGEVVVMAVTGLLVGGGVDLFFGPAKHDPGLPIPLNALLGGAIGCVAGVALIVLERRSHSGREKFRTVS